MAMERTLSIIKPDAVANNQIGEIYLRLAKQGLSIVAAKMLRLTREQAADFYAEHKERHFFDELVEYMIAGRVMVAVLEGDEAVASYRKLMGATMPQDAAPGTIRYDLARNGKPGENAVHGSDSAATAEREIAFFFEPDEVYSAFERNESRTLQAAMSEGN